MIHKTLLFVLLGLGICRAQNNRKPLQILVGHKNAVNCIDISADGKSLISGSKDETIRIWNLNDYSLTKTINGNPSSIKSLKFNNAGDKFLAGFYEGFADFNFPSGKLNKKKKKAHDGFVETACYSSDNQLILTSSWRENTLKVWNAPKFKKQIELDETVWVDNACFNHSATIILSGGHDNKVKLWNVVTGKMIQSFTAHNDWVYMVKFSADEKYVYSASLDKTIKIWEVETGKNIATLEGHTDGVITFDISSSGQYLVSSGLDKQVIIWDLKTKQIVEKFNAHLEPIYVVKFSKDGKTILTASKDATIKVWENSYQ